MRLVRHVFTTLSLLAVALLVTSGAVAQEVSAGITDVVSDSSGAAVVGANVTARDLGRGTIWPTTTNQEGIVLFPLHSAGEL